MPISHNPEKLYSDLNSKELSLIAQASADISLLLDDGGTILNVYSENQSLAKQIPDNLVGKKWLDMVVPDSITKVNYLLEDASSEKTTKFRQVNMIGNGKNAVLPMMCTSIKTSSDKKIIVIGKDLSEASKLQQDLVAAQKELTRNYLQINQLEERFRSIFEIGSESIMIIKGEDGYPIVEMNGNAIKQMLLAKNNCIGKSFLSLLPAAELSKVISFLQDVQNTGEPNTLETLVNDDQVIQIRATSFTNAGKPYLLFNLKPLDLASSPSLLDSDSLTIKAIENNAYGFIVCTPDGLILKANKAFTKLSKAKTEQDLIGTSIRNYLGADTTDFDQMMQSLRGKASTQSCVSSINSNSSSIKLVDISAVSVTQPRPCVGMIFRQVDSRLNKGKQIDKKLVRSSQELSMLVGKVPLKDILAETTDLIEQLCIKAALDLTNDNRVSASEILGLSRQSLYIKLRKHGLVDLDKDID